MFKSCLSDEHLMTWPPNSPDLNCIENLWSIVKQKAYKGGKQFDNKDDLWVAVRSAFNEVNPSLVKQLTSSMDKRLVTIFEKKGGRVKY